MIGQAPFKHLANAFCYVQELARLPPCAGTVVVRLRVLGASGAVKALEWLTDTLVPLPAAEYSAADARGDVFEAIHRRLGGALFPTCAEGALRTLPELPTCSAELKHTALGAAGQCFTTVLVLASKFSKKKKISVAPQTAAFSPNQRYWVPSRHGALLVRSVKVCTVWQCPQ